MSMIDSNFAVNMNLETFNAPNEWSSFLNRDPSITHRNGVPCFAQAQRWPPKLMLLDSIGGLRDMEWR